MKKIYFSVLALLAMGAEAPPALEVDPVVLEVALINDPDFPELDEALVEKALEAARNTYAQRFNITPPKFRIKGRYKAYDFLNRYARVDDLRCARLFGARYLGGGNDELVPYKASATKFLKKWSVDSLKGFIDEKERAGIKTHDDVYAVYARRYVDLIERIKDYKTPKGTALISPDRARERSYVAWTCALSLQENYDVLITNTFIMADLLTEPHPHAVFGKARVGGIAGASPRRKALGGQALLATTFGIDTNIAFFSELEGKPASIDERAAILGSYLLAHEVAHAVLGIPDVFDHPLGCLMTSRPGASYREGLRELQAHPEPCSKCRKWVEARALLDSGRRHVDAGDYVQGMKALKRASKRTPRHVHGGYKRRMAEVSMLVSRAYSGMGNASKAKRFARTATKLNPRSRRAKNLLYQLVGGEVSIVSANRVIPNVSTATAAGASNR